VSQEFLAARPEPSRGAPVLLIRSLESTLSAVVRAQKQCLAISASTDPTLAVLALAPVHSLAVLALAPVFVDSGENCS
jgi:hypothetical protein